MYEQVVLQDTKRLLQAEISGLRATIMRLDAKARLDAERQGAEDSGFTAVARLEEQLVRTAARLNRAKQQLYFPVSKGYRYVKQAVPCCCDTAILQCVCVQALRRTCCLWPGS